MSFVSIGRLGTVSMLVCLSMAHAAEHEVRLVNFAFQPANLVIQSGDTVTWRNIEGFHDVVSDDALFTSGPPRDGDWTFTHTFESSGEFPYFCSLHGNPGGVGMSGMIVVEGDDSPEPPESEVHICFEMSGAWFNPATPGQGFLIDVSPDIGLFFAAWFTWREEVGQYDWFTIEGGFEGDRAEAPIVRTSGGRFDSPDPVTNMQVGTAEFEFEDCGSGTVQYEFNDGTQGEIQIVRLTPVPTRCLEVCRAPE
jgi:plastocyanin